MRANRDRRYRKDYLAIQLNAPITTLEADSQVINNLYLTVQFYHTSVNEVNKRKEPLAFITAANLREAADLSYRQLNDWDEKGALPPSRSDKSSWRRFTPREFFVILVSAFVRKRFGIPLESIAWLQKNMLKDGADYFSAALQSMTYLGMPVLLLTDFKSTLVMDHPFDLSDLLTHGLLSGDSETGFVLVKVNALVNQVLSYLEEPFQIEEKPDTSGKAEGLHYHLHHGS